MFGLSATKAWAWGEIFSVRAPEEIHEGDEVTIFITASPVEKHVHRVLALSYPVEWKVKRSWAVTAGTDEPYQLALVNSVGREVITEPGHEIAALADTNFVASALGAAYFITFSTIPSKLTAATVKAALIERIDPESPQEIDKKTKKPKPRSLDWKLSFPSLDEMSMVSITGKKLAPSIRLIKGWKVARGLWMRGESSAAKLKTDPSSLKKFFSAPFTIETWFRTASPEQQMIRFSTDQGTKYLTLRTNIYGQVFLFWHDGKKREALFGSKSMAADGQWHHLVVSYDASHKVVVFLDAQVMLTKSIAAKYFQGITSLTLGNERGVNDLALDELRLFHGAYKAIEEFTPFIARSARDTMSNAFALFHFDDFGDAARSSKLLYVTPPGTAKRSSYPMYFALDSNAQLTETTSPVQTDQVLLTAEMQTPTRVSIIWKASSELNVKEYILERRVGSFGEFEEVIGADAKKSFQTPKKGQSLISRASYTVAEDLPRLKGDIDLYYRIAVVTTDEGLYYSEPVKLEYGDTKDVFVEQNDPNPFNPTTTLAFRLNRATTVKLAVYDIIGREIITLTNGRMDAGLHKFVLDASNWPGGIYFYKVKTPQSTITRKMILAK